MMMSNWNCALKKHTKCFCHIVYKTRLILINFVLIVLNIFATQYYKCFHLT